MTPAQLGTLFLLQLFVIVAACRAVGWAAKRVLGQPQVVGEMIAGVLLGPSLFGLVAPHMQAALFPKPSVSLLYALAQLGVGLYMFLVGLGFRREHFRSHVRGALAVSASGIAGPFALALLITPLLLSRHLFGAHVTGVQAALFTGAAVSITAFPMLARIIHERGLSELPLGALSLTAGAMDDAAAWIVLAVVLATFGANPAIAVRAIAGAAVFVLIMTTLGPRLLAPLGRAAERAGKVGPELLGVIVMLFLLCAFAMDSIGIHAVFGGFMLGVVMPRGALAQALRRQLEPFATAVLLPVFFTYSGLSTRLDVMGGAGMALVAGLVLVVSVAGKGGACWAAARLSGQDQASALAIAALMNSRGLMELIIVNLGLQRGIISPALASVLVLMAIVTTLMATPIFELVYGRRARRRGELELRDGPANPAGPAIRAPAG